MTPPKRAAMLPNPEGCLVRIIHPERIDQARENMIDGRDLSRLCSIYKALADPSRLLIVMALRQGEMCVCDLAALLGISESAVSHQLRRLRDLALVRTRRDAQCLYYSLDDHHVAELLNVGLEHVRE
jgi:DNA-binding transcriptional ArsR family regulator